MVVNWFHVFKKLSHSFVGTAPDKKGLEIYYDILRALLIAGAGGCFPPEVNVRDLLIKLHKNCHIFDKHISEKRSLHLIATDAADLFRIMEHSRARSHHVLSHGASR